MPNISNQELPYVITLPQEDKSSDQMDLDRASADHYRQYDLCLLSWQQFLLAPA